MDGSDPTQLPEHWIYNQIFDSWKEISGTSTAGAISFDIKHYSKLLSIFQTSGFCYLMFNLHDLKIEWCSKGIKKLLGLEPEEFQIEQFFKMMHPDDITLYRKRELIVIEFFSSLPIQKRLKYKQRRDFRMVLKDGSIKRILQQTFTVQTSNAGSIQRILITLTDVGFLGDDFESGFSFIGLDGESSYFNIDVDKGWRECINPLTQRENEILVLLSQRNDTGQIADILGISSETVKRHRKNMLSKTESRDTNGLVLKALKKGWV